jgi:Flp pilus assembly protein TadG
MKKRSLSILLTSRSAGQAMAEFAVVAAAFLLLLLGIMEMALAVNAYNDVSTAAREAARYAVVHSPTSNNNPSTTPPYSDIQQQAVNYAPFLSTSDVTVSFPADAQIPAQKDALVQITHTYPLNIPFMSAVNLQLSSSSRMLVSQ